MAGQTDRYLFHRGEHRQVYGYLGAHPSRTSTIFVYGLPMRNPWLLLAILMHGRQEIVTIVARSTLREFGNRNSKGQKGFLYKYQIETSWGEKY